MGATSQGAGLSSCMRVLFFMGSPMQLIRISWLKPVFPLSTAVVYQGGLFSDLHGSFAARCGRGGATVNLCESIELRGGRGGGPACLHRSKVANMSLV